MSLQHFPPGTSIGGRYSVIDVLGHGATGVVYSANRLASNEVIALKVIHAHLAGDQQIRGRFAREAHILERLRGAHVCPIIESGEFLDPQDASRHLLYVAMPKLASESLASRLAAGQKFDAQTAYKIAIQVCDALQCAHADGIIHRDLKPENILVNDENHATVIDFGMAKIVQGSGSGTTNLTATDMVFGTPEYMSPEQARGDELDGRCDVYALGVILYELATQQLPFQSNSPVQVLSAVVHHVPKRPREVTTRVVPAALDALIMHAIARDPNSRYSSAGALAAALARAQADPANPEAVAPTHFGTAAQQADVTSATMPEMPAMRYTPISAVVRDSTRISANPVAPKSKALLIALVAFIAVASGVALALVAK